ncbi:hypothetical protein R1sor_010444 [Riccia sorocarpa]|uniref:Nop domain-containing protein n=1 Tax=Riccia sorocarpa TaxID=122646 RepID=A0ABD3HYC9_9MARC
MNAVLALKSNSRTLSEPECSSWNHKLACVEADASPVQIPGADKMLVLFETPAGFALFQLLDEGKLDKVEDLWKDFETQENARKLVKLKAFSKFANTTEALGAATALVESKLSKGLRKFLKANCDGETLALADSKLGNIIKEKLAIDCVHNSAVMELMRGIRSMAGELITGLEGYEMAPMSLGLSHSLSRYKLKFSPDKVDTMIVQAIGLLDDLDKELNTYAMRVREWYGWHFPELGKVVQDNIQYAKCVKLMGSRTNAAKLDFSGVITEELEQELKDAAVISMGTEVSEQDMLNIKSLCDQVIALSEYRGQLFDYLRSRMNAIAPNLTVLVGELVGARLIAHAGSLINLAKHPASTVQILGAEKALFRALKTKHETPKYGLIYHASLIGQAAPKFKGKISRILAAKSALSIRLDALGEGSEATIGLENRLKVEARLRQLEGRALGKISGASKGPGGKIEPYNKDKKNGSSLISAARTYNPGADSTLTDTATPAKKQKKEKVMEEVKAETKDELMEEAAVQEAPVVEEPEKKKKKKKTSVQEGEEAAALSLGEKKKKKDKAAAKLAVEEAIAPGVEDIEKKIKKKRKADADEGEMSEEAANGVPTERKKKKKERKGSS